MGRYEFGVVKGGVWETLFVIYVCKREVGGSPFNSVYVFHLALDWPHPPPLTSGRSVGVAYGRIFFLDLILKLKLLKLITKIFRF